MNENYRFSLSKALKWKIIYFSFSFCSLREPPLNAAEWKKLLDDILELQSDVFRCITVEECVEVVIGTDLFLFWLCYALFTVGVWASSIFGDPIEFVRLHSVTSTYQLLKVVYLRQGWWTPGKFPNHNILCPCLKGALYIFFWLRSGSNMLLKTQRQACHLLYYWGWQTREGGQDSHTEEFYQLDLSFHIEVFVFLTFRHYRIYNTRSHLSSLLHLQEIVSYSQNRTCST